jgi:hypothetical protein
MAQVIKGTVGSGWLSAGQTTWWKWKITWGDAWHFWVDTAQSGTFITNKMQILEVVNHRVGSTNWAYIKLHNPGSYGSVFFLRVVRIV